MGFFSSMNAIRKVNKVLALLEKDVADYLRKSEADFINNRTYLEYKKRDILNYLQELSALEKISGNTVQCADFQFMGQKNRLGTIIYLTYQLIQ